MKPIRLDEEHARALLDLIRDVMVTDDVNVPPRSGPELALLDDARHAIREALKEVSEHVA